MRITHRMIANKVNVTLQQNLRRLQERSEQLASGKLFQRPSQDPVGANRVMRFQDSMYRNDRYRLNIGEAQGWLDATEIALMEGLDILERVGELCTYGANGTLVQAELNAIDEEVYSLYQHLIGVGNREYNGLYIFGGHLTVDPPYREVDGELTYLGDQGQRLLEIGPHQEMVMNLNGKRTFQGTEVMEAVIAVHEALISGNHEVLSGEALGRVNENIDHLLECLSEIGARQKRLEAVDNTLFGADIQLKNRLSAVEDIDLALAYTEYMMEDYAYRAALSTSAKVLQPSLVDYIL